MATIPIQDQIAQVEARARALEHFPGRMKPETVEKITGELRAAARSLAWLRDNAEWIKPIAEARRRMAEERELLLAHPLVGEFLDTFPDAEITGIRETSLLAASDSPAGSRPDAAGEEHPAPTASPEQELEQQEALL